MNLGPREKDSRSGATQEYCLRKEDNKGIRNDDFPSFIPISIRLATQTARFVPFQNDRFAVH